MKELELKHLAPYLPYGLKLWFDNESRIHQLIGVDLDGNYIFSWKPILRPLSDLVKQNSRLSGMSFVDWSCIPNYEMKNLESLIDAIETKKINHNIWEVLIEQHFDVFGLIPEGLAIDINTITPTEQH